MTTVGSLFTGYGGLDMGVMIALDSSARIAWTSDVEPGPYKLAAIRWPDTSVPGCSLLATPTANLGTCGGPQEPVKRRAGGHSVTLQDQVSAMPST